MKGVVWIVVCSGAMVFALAGLSRAPYTPPGADAAILRFSWRMSVTAREDCRPRTAEELAALPAHMRTPEVCTRDRAAYSLVTRIGSAGPDTMQLTRGGVKGDRPVFVLEERTLPDGYHRVRVGLLRVTESSGTEILAALDTVLRLERGRIQLVTLDADARRLTTRSSPLR
ncbi:MAG TPA: hypothetical protein VMM12_02505 [Longimicrobiales bacterium]|nr:hypothetical protein [Longimicrobiales bacterium]